MELEEAIVTDQKLTPNQGEESQLDFAGLVLGFCSAALTYMGVSMGGEPGGPKNLSLAKQNIEIIELLREKTMGNLTEEEKKLLDQVLTDLRLRYAEAARA